MSKSALQADWTVRVGVLCQQRACHLKLFDVRNFEDLVFEMNFSGDLNSRALKFL